MGHKSKPSLHQQAYDTLQEKAAFGRSKHQDKILGVADQYIYSFSTMETYLKACHSFVNWIKNQQDIKTELGHRPRTLEECKPYIVDWVKDQGDRGLSAYTIKMRVSALEKLYGEKIAVETPSTAREKITRSRGAAVRDSHFSESKNRDLIAAASCCGFRRFELEKCKPEDLKLLSDGSFAVEITGKGGKTRMAPVIGAPEEVAAAVRWIQASTGWNNIPGAMDVHSYRAIYACRVYQEYKRPLDTLKGLRIDFTALTGKTGKDGSPIYKDALYRCRGDLRAVFDREAMIKVSQALGHNRESVVAAHYLYGLNE